MRFVVFLLLFFCLNPLKASSSFELNSVKTDKKVIALTFDDGPKLEYAGKVLNVLDFFQIKGTFFYLGLQVKKHPNLAKKAHSLGHEIGNHSFSHEDYTQLKSSRIKKDIRTSQATFKEALGFYPNLIRPPYGSYKKSHLKLMKPHFKHLVKWNIDPRDWSSKNDQNKIKQHILDEVRPGSIILLHENERTLSMLPYLIMELQKKGYSFVTVSELISMGKN
jgi:peptidoglycan/xylan/chitin deacetylase (PgdA/CDA1 family)